jgi:hypothetical protein
MHRILLIALAGFAWSAHADTYKCTSPEGKVSYQEKPCTAGSVSRKIEIKDTSLSNDAEGDVKKKDADLARLHQAFQTRLNAGDIDGARALASTPEEFALVREAEKNKKSADKEHAADRARECEDLAASIAHLREAAALNPDNLAARNQANEAESRHISECR